MEVTNNGVVLGADKAKKDLSKYNEWLNMAYSLNCRFYINSEISCSTF